MKIGFCTNMNPRNPDGTGIECVEELAAAGYDYVEVPAAQLLGLEKSALDDATARLKASGLPVLAMNNLFQARVRVTGPDADRVRIDDYIDRLMELGRALGVETMVFGSSGARNVPMGTTREEAWKQILDMLSRLGPRAEKIGVTVAIEHINHLESNIVDWFSEGVRLARELKHPAVRCLVDFFHLDLGNEALGVVEENFDLICHAHYANILERTIPTPDLHELRGVGFLEFLKRKGYSHKISVEGYGGDLSRCIPDSLRFMRRHLR